MNPSLGMIFQNSVIQYLGKIGIPLSSGMISFHQEPFQLLEYHSIVSFSGSREGFCLVTANLPLLERIGKALLRENLIDPEMCSHIISEFTNGIAANAGENLHEDYDILPPRKNEPTNLEVYNLPIYNIQKIELRSEFEHCRVYVGMK